MIVCDGFLSVVGSDGFSLLEEPPMISEEMGIWSKSWKFYFIFSPTFKAHLNNKRVVIFKAVVVVAVMVVCVVVLVHVSDAVVEQVRALLLVVWPACVPLS